MLIIQNAKQSLDIYNEEMADDTITKALEQAEKNGTKVRIVMTYTTTNKAVFNELTQAGVDIHTFASSKKNLYIHAKMILADKNIAFIGSENFSYTSLNKNRELGIFVQDANILASLEKTFNTDWANGKEYIVK